MPIAALASIPYLGPPREVNAGQAVKLRHYPPGHRCAGAVGEGEEGLDADGCDAADRHDKANS
jgi:hypothetical protein